MTNSLAAVLSTTDSEHLREVCNFVYGPCDFREVSRDEAEKWAWLLTQEVATDREVTVPEADFDTPRGYTAQEWTDHCKAWEAYCTQSAGYHA